MRSERPPRDGLLDREREHHDTWAAEIDVAAIDVRTAFEGVTAPENRFLLAHLGDLRGKRILDVGCGVGEGGVYFATKGARVTAVDVSPGMVNTAQALGERYGVRIDGGVMDTMHLTFPDESFDVVYAANVLHHVDTETALREMWRVLVPGGRLCFLDPLRHNPIINVYRRIATEVRSEDEHPLDMSIVQVVDRLFSKVVYDTFWLSALWIFIRFHLIERVDPNKERYWKKILVEETRLRKSYCRLERIDKILKKIPFLKRYAWNIAVVATK